MCVSCLVMEQTLFSVQKNGKLGAEKEDIGGKKMNLVIPSPNADGCLKRNFRHS